MAVLSLERVSKSIGSRLIVDDLNMTVEAGEVYGFLGPNGAGKTTTIRLIVGLAKASKGKIRVLGHDIVSERSNALAHVGAIVENPETYSYLTGRQNLLHYARLAGIGERTAKIAEVIEIVGLKERIDDKVKRYSLGMRQRLGMAQALLGDPKLLILDEPTNGLDPAGMREFRELMRALAERGMSVFISSHLLSEIQLMCDRVAILKAGRIITEQRVAALTASAVVRSVTVRVGAVEEALATLARHGLQAQRIEDQVISVEVGTDGIPELIRVLVAEQIDIYSVVEVKDSLEDAFLELTGGLSVESPLPVKGSAQHA